MVVTFNRLPLLQRLVARLREEPRRRRDPRRRQRLDRRHRRLARRSGRRRPRRRAHPRRQHRRGRRLRRRARLGARARRRPGLADGRRRPARQPGCLGRLLEHDGDLDFWGPAVLAEQDPEPAVLPDPAARRHHASCTGWPRSRRPRVDGLVPGVVIPFNGVLVTRELVERIGVPRAEFFIWGDDVEYLWRAERAGARIATVVDAHFRHPATDDLGTPMMVGRTTYNHTPSDLKHYCMARNNTVNLRTYRGWPHVLMFWVKTVWFYLLTRRRAGPDRDSARGRRTPVCAATSPATGGTCRERPGETRRRRRRHLQPRRPARPRARRARRPDPRAGPRRRGRQRQHRPHPRRPRRRDQPAWRSSGSTSTTTPGERAASTVGVRTAYERGLDRIWLIDDDVVPPPTASPC